MLSTLDYPYNRGGMTSPPGAAGQDAGAAPAEVGPGVDEAGGRAGGSTPRTEALPVAAPRLAETLHPGPTQRPSPPARSSSAPVELSLDLRFTPPDKVLPRLFGALERIGADVTLLVLLRDTPEYASVLANAFQALRARGYVSDSSRVPAGGQRLRVQHRSSRDTGRGRMARETIPLAAPPPAADAPEPLPLPPDEEPDEEL